MKKLKNVKVKDSSDINDLPYSDAAYVGDNRAVYLRELPNHDGLCISGITCKESRLESGEEVFREISILFTREALAVLKEMLDAWFVYKSTKEEPKK